MNCYDQCNQQYKWWQISARRSCLQGCDVNAYQENLEASNASSEQSSKVIFTMIIVLAVLTVLFVIAKKKNWI